jgi:multiple antibiotic resistance protein
LYTKRPGKAKPFELPPFRAEEKLVYHKVSAAVPGPAKASAAGTGPVEARRPETTRKEEDVSFLARLAHDYLILFAMVNAVGNLPIFADLTSGMDAATRGRTFRTAVLTGFGIVLTFAVFGDLILRNVFALDTNSFKIAGGILVFAVAARGVIAGSPGKGIGARDYENLAVFPLGFPFLAGPGTIVTSILLFQSSGTLETVLTACLVYLSILPLLHLAAVLEKAFGRVVILVVARILYIFICAKATAFIMEGLRAFLTK